MQKKLDFIDRALTLSDYQLTKKQDYGPTFFKEIWRLIIYYFTLQISLDNVKKNSWLFPENL